MSEQDAGSPAEQGKKKKGGTVLAVVAAVLTASGGAFAGTSLLGPKVGASLAASSHEEGGRPAKDDGHGGGHGEEAGTEVQVHVIDNLVVNPAGTGASRFLLASVALAPGEKADVAELATRDIEMRDALLRLLGAKTVDELADIQLRTSLTEEMLTVLTGLLGEGWVKQIYLPQFVLQ